MSGSAENATPLAAGEMRVSRPAPSVNENLVEVIPTAGMNFIATSFIRGRGMRVPDNGYRYREGVPMQEYFQNWGQVLGQMHRLAKTYQPPSEAIKRPEYTSDLGMAGVSHLHCLGAGAEHRVG